MTRFYIFILAIISLSILTLYLKNRVGFFDKISRTLFTKKQPTKIKPKKRK